MKIKSFLAASVAAVALFASCSNEDDVKGTEPIEGVKTMAKITLTQTYNHTRAYDVTTTPKEEGINTVRLYVFNSAGILEAEEDFGANADSKIFEITTGTKTVLAAVNIPAGKLPATTKQATTLNLIKGALGNIGVDAIADASTDNQFWMTSLQDESATIVESTEADVAGGTNNNFIISVGRAVAKVGVSFAPLAEGGGKLTEVAYKIHNNPKEMRLFTSNDASGYRITPFYDVAVSPFSADNYFNNGTYLDVDGSTPDNQPAYPSYMMENSNLTPLAGSATLAVIKGKFTPTKVCDADGANPVNPSSPKFYRGYSSTTKEYGTKYYSVVPTEAALTADGCDKYVEYPAGICYYALWLKNDNAALDKVARYIVERNTFWSVTITSFTGAGSSVDPETPGIDPEDPETPPTIIPDPKDPLTADTWMKAKITVGDWTSVTQTGGI